ncbi:MAG: glycerophosphodiester phosphodiesterase family protein [Ruminococcaceae bacterium]|nr:glycerophosphodiester phosphodiesterase family protein [Oscillospiraceae bacterium]
MDFTKSVFENRKELDRPFLAAHRGVCGANIPCNTLAAYKIALNLGADVVEIDVSKTKDGKFYVFHPWMEPVFLKSKYICDMTAEELEKERLVNQDSVKTSYKVPTLSEVLTLLKGKAYINVDKFWTDVEGITAEIRKAGVEKQVIVKTYVDEESLAKVEKYAPDLMFVPLVRSKDEITEKLLNRNINLIGVEILFKSDDEECISDEYIKSMHDKGLLIWANSIIYDENDIINGYHSDDISLTDSPDKGWGWLIDKNVDFIQTDWLLMLQNYINSRK